MIVLEKIMLVNHKRIVIVGGSFGGVNAAYELRTQLGRNADITLLSKEPAFTFTPSLPWLVMAWRQPGSLQVPLAKPLERRGIHFVYGNVEALDAEKCAISAGAERFPYDALLLATGAELDYGAVPGLGPVAGFTQSLFNVAEASRARTALAEALGRGQGRIVIGVAPGASCIGPAYELVMMIDTVLKRAKKRHRFRLTYLTPEPFIGHFGIGGVGNSSRMVQDEFASRSIESVTNARIVQAEPNRLILADGQEYGFDFSLVIPAFLGSGFVRAASGLANPKGFIPVTPNLASVKYPNIYSAGVAVAIPPPFATVVPVGVPKTGHMTELMARAAAHNIVAEFQGHPMIDGLSLPSLCIADAGDTAFYMSADPFLPPRNKAVIKKGKWARYLKLAFERYYLARIQYGLPSLHFGW